MEHDQLTGTHHEIDFALHVLHSHTCNGPRFGPGAVDACLYTCARRVEEMNEQQYGKYRMLLGFMENKKHPATAPHNELETVEEPEEEFVLEEAA